GVAVGCIELKGPFGQGPRLGEMSRLLLADGQTGQRAALRPESRKRLAIERGRVLVSVEPLVQRRDLDGDVALDSDGIELFANSIDRLIQRSRLPSRHVVDEPVQNRRQVVEDALVALGQVKRVEGVLGRHGVAHQLQRLQYPTDLAYARGP